MHFPSKSFYPFSTLPALGYRFLLPATIAATLFLYNGCRPQQSPPRDEIVIGFIAGLSDRYADMGVPARDAFVLALEEYNASAAPSRPAVSGFWIDDRNETILANKVIAALREKNAVAAIGPSLSSMGVALNNALNNLPAKERIPFISPTVSTTLLSAQDDFFFRVYPDVRLMGRRLAYECSEGLALKRFIVIEDLANQSYTTAYRSAFEEALNYHGGKITHLITYHSRQRAPFPRLLAEVDEPSADAIFILTDTLDAALICQHLNLAGISLPRFASDWSATPQLISYGGDAVNGLLLLQTFDPNSRSPRFLAFQDRFLQRFGYPPDFSATHSYEATTLLLQKTEEGINPSDMRQRLSDIRSVPDALQAPIILNEYGDAIQANFLVRIDDGQFVTLKNINTQP